MTPEQVGQVQSYIHTIIRIDRVLTMELGDTTDLTVTSFGRRVDLPRCVSHGLIPVLRAELERVRRDCIERIQEATRPAGG
jgi:hypothetical protein